MQLTGVCAASDDGGRSSGPVSRQDVFKEDARAVEERNGLAPGRLHRHRAKVVRNESLSQSVSQSVRVRGYCHSSSEMQSLKTPVCMSTYPRVCT